MPTFAAIQFDRYLETKTTTLKARNDNNNTSEKVLEYSTPKLERRNTTSYDDLKYSESSRRFDIPKPHPEIRRRNSISFSSENNDANKPPMRPQITPALYMTPEPTPLPDSPTPSFPPSSPFLINHKRRGPRLMKSFSDQNVAAAAAAAEEGDFTHTRSLSEENVKVDGNEGGVELSVEIAARNGEVVVENGETKAVAGSSSDRNGEGEDFYDPQESMSYSSSIDVEDNGAERSAKAGTPLGEFYDAWEELSSDSGRQAAQRSLSDVETELREMRLSLLMEIEKRKQVEEALNSVRSNWEILREKLGVAGVTLPAELASLTDDSRSDVSPIEYICQQVHLARFISESVGRGMAKAETEAEMEAQLETKNFEIARLCDRLHYYETMNREMSQRNQEAVEIARREKAEEEEKAEMGLGFNCCSNYTWQRCFGILLPSKRKGIIVCQISQRI